MYVIYERGLVTKPSIIGSWVNCADDGVREAVGDAPQRECQRSTHCGGHQYQGIIHLM